MQHLTNDIWPPDLARAAVEAFIERGALLEPPAQPQGILAERAGTFVTLRTTVDARLRGCVGTLEPSSSTVASEIIQNAISAATRDPRFLPVARIELSTLTYGVDVLSPPEAVRGPEDLDPDSYGVIITSLEGRMRGVLLPRIEGISSVAEQWRVVHLKAGIKLGEPVRVERFTVTRFGKD
jgi:MEMO1 family protein